MNKNIVITGANRGIGLALTKQYTLAGNHVYAVCRTSTKALTELANVTIIEGIDLTTSDNVPYLKSKLTGVNINILINNAGILSEEILGEIDVNKLERQYQVNAVSPLMITEALLSNLHNGAKVILITSRMGSLSDNSSGSSYGYRMSKAALNAAGVSLAVDLKPKGIAVSLLHPGFVQTDLVGNQGDISADESAGKLIVRIEETTLSNSGSFRHANGQALPW